MPYDAKSSGNPNASATPGTEPNQFAQVGMGGSQGGGQFESGDGQSGSLQNQQGGTTTTQSVPGTNNADEIDVRDGGVAGSQGDFDQGNGGGGHQQQQDHGREQRAPGASDEDSELNTGRGASDQGGS